MQTKQQTLLTLTCHPLFVIKKLLTQYVTKQILISFPIHLTILLNLFFSKIIVKGETCTTIEYGPSDHNIWYIILRYDSHAREACEPCLA